MKTFTQEQSTSTDGKSIDVAQSSIGDPRKYDGTRPFFQCAVGCRKRIRKEGTIASCRKTSPLPLRANTATYLHRFTCQLGYPLPPCPSTLNLNSGPASLGSSSGAENRRLYPSERNYAWRTPLLPLHGAVRKPFF